MAAPVYLFTGFLDSGKSTLIKDTLNDPGFMEGSDRTLLICFEQGEVKYEEKFLDEHKTFVEYFDSPDQLTEEKIHELDTIYHPSQVFVEWNGTLTLDNTIMLQMPEYWPLVQILTTVDASTFELFLGAMRQMLYEQLKYSDTVICNRCTEDTSGTMLRGNIKAINSRAQIYYEGNFGEQVNLKSGILPFDLNADEIDVKDDDYGLWYMDAVEHPEHYDQKKVTLRGKYAENLKGYTQTFILGRQAMVCCAQDTSLCGVTVTGVRIDQMKIGDWVEVTGTMKMIPMENGMNTVVLYADSIRFYNPPKDEYVYFS